MEGDFSIISAVTGLYGGTDLTLDILSVQRKIDTGKQTQFYVGHIRSCIHPKIQCTSHIAFGRSVYATQVLTIFKRTCSVFTLFESLNYGACGRNVIKQYTSGTFLSSNCRRSER